MNDLNITLTYALNEEEEKKEEKPKKDSLDLEDEEEEKPVQKSISKTFKNNSNLEIEVSNMINKPQNYRLKVNAKFSNKQKNFEFDYLFNINSYSKVKINYLKMAISNTNEKNDSKENTIEYPKRSFKNIKATQKSVIRIKVNVIKMFLLKRKKNYFLIFIYIYFIFKA